MEFEAHLPVDMGYSSAPTTAQDLLDYARLRPHSTPFSSAALATPVMGLAMTSRAGRRGTCRFVGLPRGHDAVSRLAPHVTDLMQIWMPTGTNNRERRRTM
jgi:hypothetical protein